MTASVHRVLGRRDLVLCVKGIAAVCALLIAGPGVMSTARAQHAQGGDPERSSEAVEWRPFEEAPWCGWCRKMNREVYPELGSYLGTRLVATRLNREERSTTHRYRGARYTEAELARRLEASGVPTVVLLDANGKYLFHLSGFRSASDLRPVLAYVAEGAYRSQSLRSHLRDR